MLFGVRTRSRAATKDGWQRNGSIGSGGPVNMSISMLKRSLFTVSSRIFTGISPSSPAQAIKPVPPTPIDVKKVELGGTPWNSQGDQIIEKALPPEMLSSQVPRG